MAKVETMKGLQIFIKKIRAAPTADERERIVSKEFAKIRACFGGSSKVSSYDKKKSVWKLLYAHMMGYEVDFGHKQAADLIPSMKYDEKQVGYQALTILLNENDEFMTLLVNNVIKDLDSTVEPFQALALCFAGAVAGPEMAVAILQSVTRILMNDLSSDPVRKKAALCLLRLFRKLPVDAGIITPDVWAPRIDILLSTKSLGFKLSLMGLVNGVLERGSAGYESLQPRIVATLKSVINPASVPKDYAYYGMPHPWLQIKCLHALTFFPPPADPAVARDLQDCVAAIVDRHAITKVANLNNMHNAVLLEAVTLALHLQLQHVLPKCIAKVTGFVQQKEPNAKYVALETMSRLALVPEMTAAIKDSLPEILDCLKEPDVSIRKQAVDVLFMVCEMGSVEMIVEALLEHVAVCDPFMKEDLVLKVAILAERFAPSVAWYIDTVLTLMDLGADEVNDDVWQRVVQLVTNNEDMQRHTCENVLSRLEQGSISVPIINTAGYVLSEYSSTLAGKRDPKEVFGLLKERFVTAPPTTRNLLLTASIKLRLRHPDDVELKEAVDQLLTANANSQDAETQQRATEYLVLSAMPADAAPVFKPMPPWPERESSLMRRLLENEAPQDGEDAGVPRVPRPDAAAAAPAAEVPLPSGAEISAAPEAASPKVSGAISPKASAEAPPPPPPPPPPPEPVVDFLGFEDDAPSAGLPASSVNPFDFLEGPVAEAPPPNAQAPPAAPSPTVNPFEFLDALEVPAAAPGPPGASPTAPSAAVVPEASAPETELAVSVSDPAWQRVLYDGRGVLTEDAALQVGVTVQVNGPQCLVTLFLGNTSASLLERVAVEVEPSAAANVSVQTEVPSALQPMQQAQVPVLVTCHAAFTHPPALRVSYALHGRNARHSAPLPLSPCKFAFPNPGIAAPEFFAVWGAAPPANKAVELRRMPAPLSPDALLRAMGLMGFTFGAAPIDPNPINFAGAAVFVSTQSSQQVITRVEVNPMDTATLQVTVVADTPTLAHTFKNFVLGGLAHATMSL